MKTGTLVKKGDDVAIWVKDSDRLRYVDHKFSQEEDLLAVCYGGGAFSSEWTKPEEFKPLSLEEFMDLSEHEQKWLKETRNTLSEKVGVPIEEVPRMSLLMGVYDSETVNDLFEKGGLLSLFYLKDGLVYSTEDGRYLNTLDGSFLNLVYLTPHNYNRVCKMGLRVVLPDTVAL